MPEFENKLVIGGGIAGMSAAWWAAGQCPGASVVLLERSDTLLGGFPPSFQGLLPIASRGGLDAAGCLRGGPAAERLLSAWPGAAACEWLESSGLPLETDQAGTVFIRDLDAMRECFGGLLAARGVRILTNYPVETLTVTPEGGFRVWSRDGLPEAGRSVLLATGGERNHGMNLARELGMEVAAVQPAFVRLRLAGTKFAERPGLLQRRVHLHCEKTGCSASGEVMLSARGLEGPGLSALSAQVGNAWEQRRWMLRLRIDWVPDTSGSTIRHELQSRAQGGGRRAIGTTPLFGFNARQWDAFLQASRIDPEEPWPRIKPRRLQGLVQLLKGQSLAFEGMGLPAGERAWAGGVDLQCLDSNCQSLACPGLYFAGEILDVLGAPGGPHWNLAWASAHLAGNAMGRA